VLCAEINVVRVERLCPRALLTPFTDNVDLTVGDRSMQLRSFCAQRLSGIVSAAFRAMRADFEIDGVAIQDGDLLLLDIGSANHDPSMFSNPDRADISRKHAAHLTFGYGAHYCIGAPLARIELKTVFAQMIPRFPSMHLAVDAATLTIRYDVLAGGLHRASRVVVSPDPANPRWRGRLGTHDRCSRVVVSGSVCPGIGGLKFIKGERGRL
jgi:hypothetical protein